MVRAIREDDAPRLIRGFRTLSAESIRHRFLTPRKRLLPAEARFLANVDYQHRMAFVASIPSGEDEELIAVARYDATGCPPLGFAGLAPGYAEIAPGFAEMAIVTQDRFQSQGIGRLLFERLAAYARQQGLRGFFGYTLRNNTRITGLLRATGYPLTYQSAPSSLTVGLELS